MNSWLHTEDHGGTFVIYPLRIPHYGCYHPYQRVDVHQPANKKLILTFAKKDQYQLETGSSNIVTRDVLMCYKLCYSVLKYI